MPVPRVTHQVWMQGWDQLPRKFHGNVQKLRQMNPDWMHRTWDENQLRKACEEYGPECVTRFDGYEHLMQKVDFGRYVVLYLYGGVTVDCDMEAIKPLSEIPEIDFSPLIVGKSNDCTFETAVITFGHVANHDWFINSGFICAEPRNPDVKKLVESCIHDKTRREDYFSQTYFISTTTGPIRISTVLKGANMTIMYPDVVESEYVNNKSVFIHKHELSWSDASNFALFKGYLFVKENKMVAILIILLAIYAVLLRVKQ